MNKCKVATSGLSAAAGWMVGQLRADAGGDQP